MTHRSRPIAVVVLVAVTLAAIPLIGPGCSKPATVEPDTGGQQRSSDPWARVGTQLRKEFDPPAARRILGQLNTDLSAADPKYQPTGLSPEAEKPLRDQFGLTEDEVKELRPSTFTPLDAHYLAECMALRETVRSLVLAGLPPARQAEIAFAWVCRQVALSPWNVTVLGQTPARNTTRTLVVPVPAILRRGSGSGLERAYVFLALAQQLGMDGCLVGPSDAAAKSAAPSTKPGETNKGPFWAVGVRSGPDVFLFDPWRGEPVAGPAGRPATLAEVRADPDLAKPSGVSADEAKAAEPVLTAPLSALAPRMRRLEQELKGESGVRLAVDPAAVAARFAAEAKTPGVKFWNPPTGDWLDRNTPTRVLVTFLPQEEGGAGGNDDFYQQYRATLIPRPLILLPQEILATPDDPWAPAMEQLYGLARLAYDLSFLTTPSPREQIQRGQFDDAVQGLVTKQKAFARARERVRTDKNREEQIRKWCEEAKQVFANQIRARLKEKAEPGAAEEAQQQVAAFWQRSQGTVGAIVDLAVADAGEGEATYLLALAMHEQAERAQARYETAAADPKRKDTADRREKAAGAWAEAKNWWSQYDQFAASQEKAFPGRAAHAKHLGERAARLAAETATR